MTSSLKAQRLADNFLGQSVKLLSVLTPHFRGIDICSALIVRLCGDRDGDKQTRKKTLRTKSDGVGNI